MPVTPAKAQMLKLQAEDAGADVVKERDRAEQLRAMRDQLIVERDQLIALRDQLRDQRDRLITIRSGIKAILADDVLNDTDKITQIRMLTNAA